MLALVLAAALDPNVERLLTTCDGPKMQPTCAAYLTGFVDAIVGSEEILNETVKSLDVAVAEIACIPDEVKLNQIRLIVVKALRRNPSTPPRNTVLRELIGLYPCGKGK